jgi:hypothetical protein
MILLGLEMKAFRFVDPSFVEMGNVSELTLGLTKSEANTSRRSNEGWRTRRAALKDMEVSFTQMLEAGDADVAAIDEAFDSGTPIKMRFLDGPSASGNGWEADYDVFEVTQNEPLEEAVTRNVVLRPTTAPQRVTGGSIASMTLKNTASAPGAPDTPDAPADPVASEAPTNEPAEAAEVHPMDAAEKQAAEAAEVAEQEAALPGVNEG